MSEARFLNGKVVRRTLPVVTPPFGARTPMLKRLRLPQGELAQFFDGEPAMRYMAVIELRPGTVRGNHFHREKEEWVYVISGELQLAVVEEASGERASLTLGAGDLALVPPGIAHAMQPTRAGFAIEFSPTPFDAADTIKHVVVEG